MKQNAFDLFFFLKARDVFFYKGLFITQITLTCYSYENNFNIACEK